MEVNWNRSVLDDRIGSPEFLYKCRKLLTENNVLTSIYRPQIQQKIS